VIRRPVLVASLVLGTLVLGACGSNEGASDSSVPSTVRSGPPASRAERSAAGTTPTAPKVTEPKRSFQRTPECVAMHDFRESLAKFRSASPEQKPQRFQEVTAASNAAKAATPGNSQDLDAVVAANRKLRLENGALLSVEKTGYAKSDAVLDHWYNVTCYK
jgi:hypothetical protein